MNQSPVPEAIRVLLCDDHAIFRDGIKATLANEPRVNIVAEAENGVRCLELLPLSSAEVVLMDINMPEMDGIECLQRITESFPKVKVIALTQFDERRFVKQMLKHGAAGYLSKSTSREELVKAIQTVLNGEQYFSDEIAQKVNGVEKGIENQPLFPDLSERELEIIQLMSRGLSTKSIAEKVFLSVNTVETHRGNIFRKLGVNNVASLVRWAVNNDLD